MNGVIRYTIRPYDTFWMLAQIFNTTVESIMQLNPGVDPHNLQVGQVINIRPGLGFIPSSPMDNDMDDMDEIDMMLPDLLDYFHTLWGQHIMWTRMVILGIIFDLPDLQYTTERLLRNAQDFAEGIRVYYGDEAAQTFENLFRNHITLAADFVTAAKANEEARMDEVWQSWTDNAGRIAEFLSQINPNWSTEDWNAMLMEHLQLLAENTMLLLEQNYQASIDGFDDIYNQAMEMADMMAEGIATQFPG
ncbi:LysM domain-containing protein [Herbinix hemicellulosilytica]|uniref:LysM domain-containing protein n=1 Tax=Herbinix hemicellulosilytica TaxID=1564487 RepID=A0A0H5SEV7_HERHM|nr:LysM domain-containing protein [Herbinix hemicellulosilytica]RBP60308.1 LysM domain-containing protein [Herbinix hemicellulosilytica]CRZ33550.1 hypothetical protein HHT355_0342 [Herbinix hemicellulosilytica]